MRAVIVALVVLCGLVALATAQTRPNVPEVFSAGTEATIHIGGRNRATIHGKGYWATNQPEGRSNEVLEITEESHKHYNVRMLQRFDLHRSYEVVDDRTCHVRTENGTMPLVWGWLSGARYVGTHKVEHLTLQLWNMVVGYGNLTLGVLEHEPNRPQYFWVHAAERNTTVRFTSWSTAKPHENFFTVPSQCSHNQLTTSEPMNVGCVSRSSMISRAEVWVNNRVPYNQGGLYQGYREDCSGYVSMAWESSKPGHTTFTMHEIAHPVSKDALQPGDCLLCASEHVVLFGGWTSGAKTHYTAFEETRPGEGTVKRVTPYPYWYNTGCFKPYRYNAVC